jgi:hypothetical protein
MVCIMLLLLLLLLFIIIIIIIIYYLFMYLYIYLWIFLLHLHMFQFFLGDGLLNVQELRTLITRLYPIPTSYDNWLDFEAMLLNCSHYQEPLEALGVGVGPDSREVKDSFSFFLIYAF